jgi:aminoglycoside 6-adenylyltransferase
MLKDQVLNLLMIVVTNFGIFRQGIKTSFSLSVGKAYKYLDKYVSEDLLKLIQESYKYDSIDRLWDSLIIICKIFNEETLFIVNELKYEYPKYGEKVIEYIKQFIPLNKDMKEL